MKKANSAAKFMLPLNCVPLCSRLDYDFIPRHTYVFIVTATDGGGRQGHTEVRIEMENVNDELPTMYPGQQIVSSATPYVTINIAANQY